MKSMSLLLLSGVFVLLAGCSFVGLEDVSPNWHESRALSEPYEVVNPKALGVGYIHQISLVFLPIFRWGGSFEDGRQDILDLNPGADDVINVRSDVTGMNFLLYQCYHVNIHGAAIKYTGGGVGNADKMPEKKITK